ncbi:MAG: MarR family transcriptional regulator [Myxococcota bacterium]
MTTEREIRESHFVEEVGLLADEMGETRMIGRVIGHLLICDPPHQTAQQIAEQLDASRGAVSSAIRQLLRAGILDKHAVPNSRATYVRIQDHPWPDMLRRWLAFLRIFVGVADQGLELLASDDPERRRRLERLREFFVYLEHEFPPVIDRYSESTDKEAE